MAVEKLPPPPATGNDPLDRWLNNLYRRLGEASGVAPLSVTGTAATITGELAPEQLSAPIPVDKGGTGATDAASAAANLGLQSAFFPSDPLDVPIYDGSDFEVRRLTRADIQGVPITQTVPNVNMTAVGTAGIGDFADTVIPWTTAFSDTNYAVSLSIQPTVGDPKITIAPSGKATNSITLRMTNGTAVASDAVIDVTGIHD